MEVLFVYKRELYADSIESTLKKINPETYVDRSLLGNNLDEYLQSRIYDMIFVANDLDLNVDMMAKKFIANNPNVKIVLIADVLMEKDVNNAVKYNINGILRKNYSSELIECIIRLIIHGEKFFPKELVTSTIEPLLTEKEVDILQRIKNGDSNKQIAYDMNLAESTIKAHITKMFKKFKCYNRIQLIQKADEDGYMNHNYPNKY